MKRLIKQPNGKFYMDKEKYNLTEQEVIDIYIERAKVQMENPEHFSMLIKNAVERRHEKLDDSFLKEIGFEQSFDELTKFIPMKVENQSYYGRDCTSYGKCPKCDAAIQSGISGTDNKCPKCSQMLKW